jgi:regulator of sigma D
MLDQCSTEERWNGVSELIERWRLTRQSMLVQFCEASGVLDSSATSSEAKKSLQQFCQLLVDYVSSGHFEVYYQLLREAEEFKDGGAELAKTLLPQITASTEASMEFNDKYAQGNGDLTSLSNNLSKLGEILESRFELEDQLIEILHEAHRVQVA